MLLGQFPGRPLFMDEESDEEEGDRADDAEDDDDTLFSVCPVSGLLALHHLVCFASDEIEGGVESGHFVGCELDMGLSVSTFWSMPMLGY